MRLFLLLSLLLLILPGCSSPVPPPAAPLALPTPVGRDAASAAATRIAAPETAASGAPAFANLRFATQPETPPEDHFPEGTPEVYALWEYANLTASDVVRRVWTRNGQEWLVREAAWDLAGHGASGTAAHVSVYDYTGGGLAPGVYELALSVNGRLAARAGFTIAGAPQSGVVTLEAAAGAYLAQVVDDTRLQVTAQDGGQLVAAMTGLALVDLVWAADGRHLLVVDRDRSGQVAPHVTIGVRHALWLVDAGSGQLTQLGSFAEDLHTPRIAPDGRAVALLSGSGFGDACGVDLAFFLLRLDGWQRTALLSLADFAGAPQSERYTLYPQAPGRWQADGSLALPIAATCLPLDSASPAELRLPGVYRLWPETGAAERIGELESWQA